MKKASKKKQPARAVKMFGTGKHRRPDLRTKAGRAWKARRAAREDRKQMRAEIARLDAEEKARRARNREADKAAAKAAVTGSWVDLKDHPANKTLRETYAEMDKPAYLTNVPTDMDKLKSTGMYWELFPEGPDSEPLSPVHLPIELAAEKQVEAEKVDRGLCSGLGSDGIYRLVPRSYFASGNTALWRVGV